jgi:hypothetical protein
MLVIRRVLVVLGRDVSTAHGLTKQSHLTPLNQK